MFRALLRILRLSRPNPHRAPIDIPTIPRDQLAHLFHLDDGLPHVDWAAADAWIGRTEPDEQSRPARRRAIAAAWLDELRDSLKVDHRRWRHAHVEGLGPLEGDIALRIARAADRAYDLIGEALRPLRGKAGIPPVAIVALDSSETYYTFIAHYYPDEGQWGTSGGMYINEGADAFPMIVLPVQVKHSVEETIAHELTHHALKEMDLPIWLEEGLTQMMEERVTGQTGFRVSHEMIQRHRAHWSEVGAERFWSGEAFHSAEDDEQELAYHLAQLIVRSLLSDRPKEFFAFAHHCAGEGTETSAANHLGIGLADLEARWMGGGESSEEDSMDG